MRKKAKNAVRVVLLAAIVIILGQELFLSVAIAKDSFYAFGLELFSRLRNF